jgi:DNA-binding beta-propeller fold protein YncE
MRYAKGLSLVFGAVAAVGIVAVGSEGRPSAAQAAPTNSAPNPYETIADWAKMPEGRTWGSTSAVDVDKDGKSIWVAERCGANSCAGSNLDPILHFDENGKLIKSFGKGMFIFPHGIFVDRDGNIWVTDGQGNQDPRGRGRGGDTPAPPPPAEKIGHQVYKFSPDGKVLLTLGTAGGGKEPDYFFQPNDVIVAPNGDIIVAEGHGGENSRLLRFDKTGKLIKSFGKKGAGMGEFNQPHALAYDSRGRLFVGDRSNNRILIYDDSFKQLDEWKQFSRPSGIYIDKNDVIYVADSESGSVDRTRTDWKRGIRVGSAKTGAITAFIPDPAENPPSTSAAEGVAVDAAGHIYGAEVGPKALKRYVKK